MPPNVFFPGFRTKSDPQTIEQVVAELRELRKIVHAGVGIHGNTGFQAPKVGVNSDNPPDEELLTKGAIEAIYGATPKGMDQDLMASQDQSVAEVISMNRNIYDYADQVDQERERILVHAQVVSPQGAAKLQNQSLAVLIGVMTQLLRTQSQMLKIMGQNMALENRKEKMTSSQFIENYQGLSNGFKSLPKDTTLPNLNGGE